MNQIKNLLMIPMTFLAIGLTSFSVTQAADDKNAICDDSHAGACIIQAEALIKNNQLEAGKQLLIKACNYREARGCLKVGIVAERTGNFSEAKSFYQKSCDLKDERPCKNVAAVEKKMKK